MGKKKEIKKILKVKDVPAFRVASGFVSTNPTRFGINGIHIGEKGEVVATDGHILFTSPDCVEPPEKPITIVLSRAIPKSAFLIEIDLERRALFVYLKNMTKSGQLFEFSDPIEMKFGGYLSATGVIMPMRI